MIYSEDVDATYAFDLSLSVGEYYHDLHEQHTVSATTSQTSIISIWCGETLYQTRPDIIANSWCDTGSMSSTTANKYYAWMTFTVDGQMHAVAPTVEYATQNGAIVGGATQSLPSGLENHPKSTCIILKGDDSALPTAGGDRWIDIRLTLPSSPGGTVSDHGNLSGLADDDHPHYVLNTGDAMGGTYTIGNIVTTYGLTAATSTITNLTISTGIVLPNDVILDAHIDWGNLTDLNAGGEVVWGNVGAGELADDSVQADDIDTINCGTGCTWDTTNDEIDIDITDQVGTLTTGDLCINDGSVVNCTVNTIAELETALDAENILIEDEIDGSSELAAIMDDETGDGLLVFNNNPTITDLTITYGMAAATSSITNLTVVTGIVFPNDVILDAMIDWGNLADLVAGGEVTWSNLASGELTSEVLLLGTDVKAGTLTDTKICTWDNSNSQISCDYTDLTGGGGGSGAWATTTDGIEIIYAVETTSDVVIGSNATATAEFWFDESAGNLTITGNLISADGFISTSDWTTTSAQYLLSQSAGDNLTWDGTEFDIDDVFLTLTNFYSTTTEDIAEGGTNLYFTTARVDSHLSGGTGIGYSSGAITFDCSEVEGTGINCGGSEEIELDATGDWTGIFDGLEGSVYYNTTSTQMSNDDFGDFSCDGTDQGCSLDTGYLTLTAWYSTTTEDIAEGGTNYYYTTQRFATDLAATNTDALAQGSTNLYQNSEITNWIDDVTLGASGALTLPAGQDFIIGAITWSTTDDKIDGEQIYDDTVDNDSIDWADMIDLTTDGAVSWSNLASGELTSEVLLIGTDVKAGTLTDTKYCIWDTANTQIVCDSTPAGSGDVEAVGDCASGLCLDGTSDGGTNITFYNIDSNKTQLIASDIASDLVITLPIASMTIKDWEINSGTIHTDNYIENPFGASIDTGEITAGTILEVDLDVDEEPADDDILTFDTTGDNFSWQTPTELGLLYSGGTLTDTQICVADGTSGGVDCNIAATYYVQDGCTDCLNDTEIDDIYLHDGANDTMTGTLTADGFTLGSTEILTIGSGTLTHDATDFVFDDTVTITGDSGGADDPSVPMTLYNTDDTPPAASGFPIGTIYIQYTP